MKFPVWLFFLGLLISVWSPLLAATQSGPAVMVGVARLDITPELPIRLSGYSGRPGDAVRSETRLFARALAIGSDREKPAVLITVGLIGIGDSTRDGVAAALQKQHGIEPTRLANGTEDHIIAQVHAVVPVAFTKKTKP